jgi:hypothetical protein
MMVILVLPRRYREQLQVMAVATQERRARFPDQPETVADLLAAVALMGLVNAAR